jgi:hypothetical protein
MKEKLKALDLKKQLLYDQAVRITGSLHSESNKKKAKKLNKRLEKNRTKQMKLYNKIEKLGKR